MSLESDAQILSALPIFEHLEHEAVRLLAFQAETSEYSTGDTIFEFGQKASGALVILDGAVGLSSSDSDKTFAREVTSGELIGQLALITDVTHRVSGKALKATTILGVQRSSFQRLLREYPGSAAKIRATIAADLLNFTKSLEKIQADH